MKCNNVILTTSCAFDLLPPTSPTKTSWPRRTRRSRWVGSAQASSSSSCGQNGGCRDRVMMMHRKKRKGMKTGFGGASWSCPSWTLTTWRSSSSSSTTCGLCPSRENRAESACGRAPDCRRACRPPRTPLSLTGRRRTPRRRRCRSRGRTSLSGLEVNPSR